jgi:hypothetical protein
VQCCHKNTFPTELHLHGAAFERLRKVSNGELIDARVNLPEKPHTNLQTIVWPDKDLVFRKRFPESIIFADAHII